jgi:hypothetical protein
MLKKNDEKINGFLMAGAFSFLLPAFSYYRFASSLCVLHRLQKTLN